MIPEVYWYVIPQVWAGVRSGRRRIGFAPWVPPTLKVDDPDRDTETFAEQRERMQHVCDM
jgi:hypothetical protein